MPLVTTKELVGAAGEDGVLAFNAVTLEHLEAIVTGAEAARAGAIVQISQNAVAFHGGQLGPLAAAAVAAANESDAPIALHLDHVTDDSLVYAAAGVGFSSVMFDAAHLGYTANVAATRAITQWAHHAGLWVEAELGYVGGKDAAADNAHAPGVRTDPEQAQQYVDDTGVDALAVAVGTSHAMTERTAQLDLDLIARLRHSVPVPLVLHGSSGVPPDDLRSAIRAGIVKVNIGTALGMAWTEAVRACLCDPTVVDPRRSLTPARSAMRSVVVDALTTLTRPSQR